MNFPFDFFSYFTSLGLDINPSAVASFVFFVVALVTALVSLILFFHWRKYGLKGKIFVLVEIVYLAVSAILLAVAFFSIK